MPIFSLNLCYLLVSMKSNHPSLPVSVGQFLMRFESLEPPQFSLHVSQFAFKSVAIEDFATG